MRDTIKPNIPGFISAILSHWVSLMSGGVAVVGLGLWERFAGYAIPRYTYLIIILMFIVLACFLAWKDARVEMRIFRVEAEKEQSLLQSQLDIKEIQLKSAVREQERLSQEQEEAKSNIAYLRSIIEPKLEIMFEEKEPYVEYVQERGRIGRNGFWKIYRVGVKNLSGDELYSVSVELENYEARNFENVPFRVMHNVSPPYRESFSMRPLRSEYVDIVMRAIEAEKGSGHKATLLCFTRSFGLANNIGLSKPVPLNIIASAAGAQPCRRRFTLYIDEKDQLQMKPADDELASDGGEAPSS
jgi:hypothetical protein